MCSQAIWWSLMLSIYYTYYITNIAFNEETFVSNYNFKEMKWCTASVSDYVRFIYAKIRPQIIRQGICILPSLCQRLRRVLPETMGGETSAGNCQQSFRVITVAGWGQVSHLGCATLVLSWKCPEVSQNPKDMQKSLVGLKALVYSELYTRFFSREMVVFLFSKVTWEFLLGARIETNRHTFGLPLILLFLNIAFELSDFQKRYDENSDWFHSLHKT